MGVGAPLGDGKFSTSAEVAMARRREGATCRGIRPFKGVTFMPCDLPLSESKCEASGQR